jgi:hypothetical protein
MPIGNYNNIGGFYQQPSNTQNLDSAYQEILKMRATPYNNYRTVFNDISDEWNGCSEEERKFIEQDREYAQANLEYAQQFNAFLLEQFGLQFANSKYGSSAEKVLLSMKNARGRFRTSTIEDVNRIKNENAALQRQIKELEELINGQ